MRKYPDIIDSFINLLEPSIQVISNNSKGLSSLVWILGEFGEKLPSSPYILESLLDNYSETESNELINSILLTACKLFFKTPGEMQEILGKVFDFIFTSFNDIDLKDRASYFYNLLKSNIEEAEYIICGERVTVDKFVSSQDELSDKIFLEFNSLSVLYNKPEEKFIKKYIEDDENKEDEDNKEENEVDETNNSKNKKRNENRKEEDDNSNKFNNENKSDYNEAEDLFSNIPIYSMSNLSGKAILKEQEFEEYYKNYHNELTKEHSPIPEEVEPEGFAEYLEENNIFVKAYKEENKCLKMYLYSLDVS